MKIETTKMSSRGQIVIPQNARDELNAEEGTIFVVMAKGDTLILKKVETPSKEILIRQLENIAAEGNKNSDRHGIKESEVVDIVHKFRESKRTK